MIPNNRNITLGVFFLSYGAEPGLGISPTTNEGFHFCSSTMDACNSTSVLLYRTSTPVGKVRRRVQDLRIPSSSYCDCTAGGSKLDLSHNESARLAADCLLSQGLEGYQEVLKAEGEVDFLSELEKHYVLQHGRDAKLGLIFSSITVLAFYSLLGFRFVQPYVVYRGCSGKRLHGQRD